MLGMDMRGGRGDKIQFDASHLSRNPVERYLRVMTDYMEYDDSDFAFTVELQAAVHKRHHPQSCEKSSFLSYYVFVTTKNHCPSNFPDMVSANSSKLPLTAVFVRVVIALSEPRIWLI
jgi:hypothetical protein